MPISVTCPSGHKINAPEKYAGKVVKCPKCSQAVQIPNMAEEVPMAHELPAVESADPLGNFSADMGQTAADPFAEFANMPPASYSPASYPAAPYAAAPYSAGGNAAAGGASRASSTSGNKPAGKAQKSGIPILWIGIAGGGAMIVLLSVVVIGFIYMSSSPGGGSVLSALGGQSEADREFELIKSALEARFGKPDSNGNVPREEEKEIVLNSMRKMCAADAVNYFGYDAAMRKRMREYLMTQQVSEAEAALIAMEINGSLKKMSEEFQLKPAENGKVEFLVPMEEGLKQMETTEFKDEMFSDYEMPLKSLVQGLNKGTLSPDQKELAFYASLWVTQK